MRLFINCIIVFICLMIQTTLFNFVTLEVHPDILLVLTIFLGKQNGGGKGAQYGAVIGLLQDLLSFGSIGINMISKSFVGFTVGFLEEHYLFDTNLTSVVTVLVASLFDYILYSSFISMLYGYLITEHLSFGVIITLLFFNLLVAIVLFPTIDALERTFPASIKKN